VEGIVRQSRVPTASFSTPLVAEQTGANRSRVCFPTGRAASSELLPKAAPQAMATSSICYLRRKTGGAWTLTPLHQLAGGNDGSDPSGDLLKRGNAIFGTTQGSARGFSTVYKLIP